MVEIKLYFQHERGHSSRKKKSIKQNVIKSYIVGISSTQIILKLLISKVKFNIKVLNPNYLKN